VLSATWKKHDDLRLKEIALVQLRREYYAPRKIVRNPPSN